ncbi:MAG: ABC transporter substrate-binding protein, partial [Chloroflexota bacterium]
ASMAGLGTLLAACSSTPAVPAASPAVAKPTAAPAAVPTAAQAAAPAKPKRGGTLKVASHTFGDEAWLIWKHRQMTESPGIIPFENLTYYDPKDPYKITPGIAESWTNTDLKNWTFKIRKGVKWDKNYGEVTADDVAYTINMLATTKGSLHPDAPYWKGNIADGMKVTDPYTLTFNLKTPEPTLPSLMSPWRCTTVMCKKYVQDVGDDKADREPLGTGPYRMSRHVGGSVMEFEPVGETHWRSAPRWDKMEFQFVPEASTRLASLQTGRVDLAVIGPDQVKQVQDAGLTMMPSWGKAVSSIIFGGLFKPDHPKYTGKDPWHDVKVREAMSIALDRAALNKSFYGGLGTYELSPGANIAPLSASGDRKIPYDPAKAKQLLQAAGKEGFSFKLISVNDDRQPNIQMAVQAMAGYWQAIGLKPVIVAMDDLTWNTKRVADDTNGCVFPFSNTVNVIYGSRYLKFFYSKPIGSKNYNDDHIDKVYEEVLTMTDMAKRDQMLKDATLYLLDNWTSIHLMNIPTRLYAANPKVVSAWEANDTSVTISWENIEPKL